MHRSVVLRQATRDLELPLDDGRRFQVRAGDRVCLYPYLMHHDPEIFAEPERFQYDRFLAAPGPAQFFLRGKRLTLPLMPYGGGISMCPGRFLAHQEIKIFVAVVLKSFTVELRGALPPFELTRAGIGTFPPAHDVPSRWRQRE